MLEPEQNNGVFEKARRLDSDEIYFTPTRETLQHFPAVTLEGLSSWELDENEKAMVSGEKLTFRAFQLVFPKEAMRLIVDKVSV